MISSSETSEQRRCRPLLGTFVEIAAPSGGTGARAIAAAFAAVERVQRSMSAHSGTSDLARIADARAGERVPVDRWTYRVLAAAREIAGASAGAFDPVAVAGGGARDGATWRDLELLDDRRSVRCRRALRVDLGGIAKGFAVDQAVRALRRSGSAWGLVNAGGDLRAFGSRRWPLQVRRAGASGELIPLGEISDIAVATSARSSEFSVPGPRTSGLPVDPRAPSGRAAGLEPGATLGVTVFARTALVADALTKGILFADATAGRRLLQRFRARAVTQIAPGDRN
jgi:FAD:protein FMN transferase